MADYQNEMLGVQY